MKEKRGLIVIDGGDNYLDEDGEVLSESEVIAMKIEGWDFDFIAPSEIRHVESETEAVDAALEIMRRGMMDPKNGKQAV